MTGRLSIHHTSAVHSLGMRFAIDVAFLDRKLVVLDMTDLRPWRMTLPRQMAERARSRDRGVRAVGSQRATVLELRCGNDTGKLRAAERVD